MLVNFFLLDFSPLTPALSHLHVLVLLGELLLVGFRVLLLAPVLGVLVAASPAACWLLLVSLSDNWSALLVSVFVMVFMGLSFSFGVGFPFVEAAGDLG